MRGTSSESTGQSSRLYNASLIADLIRHFSHGAGDQYDPRTEMGGQRESVQGLGFGALFAALAEVLSARDVLIIGSGRGFSVACFGLSLERHPERKVRFVDPGFVEWRVGATQRDQAPGLWTSPDQMSAHFRNHLGLENIESVHAISDEAFSQIQQKGQRFDLVLIDGEHGYMQALRDLRSALGCLRSGGMVLAHDARCYRWPGVALALEHLRAEDSTLESLILSPYPGLALIQKRQPLLTIRRVTIDDNHLINRWRREAGVTERPTSFAQDPHPGQAGTHMLEGLYGVWDDSELIGGFGLRWRTFDGPGPDDFVPDDGIPRQGFLLYGGVLTPCRRGGNVWDLVRCEILGWVGAAGYYSITTRKLNARSKPYRVDLVGRTPVHLAFHHRPLHQSQGRADPPPREGLQRMGVLEMENAQLRDQLAVMEASRSWRLTRPLRALFDKLHGAGHRRSSVPGVTER